MKRHCGHGGCFIQVSSPNDNLCLARALVVAKARIDKETDHELDRKWKNIQKSHPVQADSIQKRMALALMRQAGLQDHVGPCGEQEIRKLQEALQPEYQIKIFSSRCCNFLTFQGKIPAEKVLHIYHDYDEESDSGHFIIITKPHVIFSKQYWCDSCNSGFDNQKRHKCMSKCNCCFELNKCPLVQWKFCSDCNRWFRSDQCFQNHLSVAQPRGENKKAKVNASICQKIRRCLECKRLLNLSELKQRSGQYVHNCGLTFCRMCDEFHEDGATKECYMKPFVDRKKAKQEAEKKKAEEGLDDQDKDLLDILEGLGAGGGGLQGDAMQDTDERHTRIFFDFECRKEREVGENKLGPVFAHDANFCAVLKVCDGCKDSFRKKDYGTCDRCGPNRWIFEGLDCRDKFCKWLFSEENRPSVVIAHNAKGYDSQFIVQYLIKQALVPKVICQGLEFMMIEYSNIRILDSLNFLPMPLAALPKAFGEVELKKGFFPFNFNTLANQNYKGPYPDAWFYSPGTMMPAKRQEFHAWYAKQRGKEFDMQKELREYCESDTGILARCCLNFEDLFFEVTGIRIFDVSVTIASACMRDFQKNHLKPGTIGIIPLGGYKRWENQSIKALKWLMWISESDDLRIQHTRNDGEWKIGNYKVDGWDDANQTVYEFHGCIWHGCPRCYPDRSRWLPGDSKMVQDAYESTLSRISDIRSTGVQVVEMWECDLDKELVHNAEMKDFFTKTDIPEPMDPREALRGGRTNATTLLVQCREDQYLSYKDVVSLYPWGVKYAEYPVGHPTIISENFAPITADNFPYFGLIRCSVVPPKRLYHPVLPYFCNGKLYFPLCRTCAETQQQDYCMHADAERELKGCWVSTELRKALRMDYRITKVHMVWHYPETDKHDSQDQNTGLFTKYINIWLKIKIEASGWPERVQMEAQRKAYLQECLDREGFELDPSKIEKNSGLCSLAKLALNSIWGKFGQRCNLSRDEFVIDPAKFSDILFDETNIVHSVRPLSEEMVFVSYTKAENHVEVMRHTNPVIAAFTTAHCRLRLYKELEALQDRVCYFDTDSVIYITDKNNPLQHSYHPILGEFLGDMMDEVAEFGPGAVMDSFVSAGPKNYAFRVRKADGSFVYKVKIRGFSLNHTAAARLNFKTLRKTVIDHIQLGQVDTISVVGPQIVRYHDREIRTKQISKLYSFTFDKRWILDDYSTLPYGTCREAQ